MEQLKKRDEGLDAVKGFAILLVMLGHCIVLNNLSDPYLYDAIVAIQMPLFMAVSGFTAGVRKTGFEKRVRQIRETYSILPAPFFFHGSF